MQLSWVNTRLASWKSLSGSQPCTHWVRQGPFTLTLKQPRKHTIEPCCKSIRCALKIEEFVKTLTEGWQNGSVGKGDCPIGLKTWV